jgi:hypothetical protein
MTGVSAIMAGYGAAIASPSYVAGLFKGIYGGYFNDYLPYFDESSPYATSVETTEIFHSDDNDYYSVQWLGYFKPTTTQTYTFFLNSDDASYMWIGPTAVTGFTTDNALINNGGLHGAEEVSGSIALTAGQYYPVRIMFGENEGDALLAFSYQTPTISQTPDVTGKVFYNPATNGF